MLTQRRLRTLLQYRKSSGQFRYKVARNHMTPVGEIAGCLKASGYLELWIDGKIYKAHRLVWLYCFGAWPEGYIDHIDGCKHNNRLANLRDVTPAINAQNQKYAKSCNKSGVLGVVARHKKFRAQITICGRTVAIGTYETSDEAHAAYLLEKRKRHAGCTI